MRQAAADAAMRWGVGAGAARVSCGTMTLHRRLEERLAAFTGRRAALLFGSGALANLGVIPALARRGEVVLHDELSHSSIVDGCRLSGADVVAYRHADAEHLAWALRQCDGRATLIATDGMFGMDGDVAPLADIAALARRYDARVLVDEAHALGALGPGGRGAVAEAGLEDEIHVVTGTLGKALGSYGGFVACDHVTARFLVHSARTLLHSTALPPVAAAAAMAALDLLEDPSRAASRSCARTPRRCATALAREGFDVSGAAAHVVPLVVGDAELACRIVDHALEQGVFAEAVRPPAVPEGTARVRLSVMASHTRPELREAATVLGARRDARRLPPGRRPARRRGPRPRAGRHRPACTDPRTRSRPGGHIGTGLRGPSMESWPLMPQSSTCCRTPPPGAGPSTPRTHARVVRHARRGRAGRAAQAVARARIFLHDRYHRVRALVQR